MKKQKLIIADVIAIILSLITIYLPSFTNNITFFNYYYLYMVAYFAVIFSNTKDSKVLYTFIPLLSLSFLMIFIKKVDIYNYNEVFSCIYKVIFENYKFILEILILFLVERISTKVFGAYFSKAVAFVFLILFLVLKNTSYIEFLKKYDFYIFLAFVYFSFARILPAKSINKYLYIIFVLAFFIEILIIDRYKIFIGFHISLLILIYLILKGDIYKLSFEKFFLGSILYLLPFIKFLLEFWLRLSNLNLLISSSIITFFVSVILYQMNFKFLNYLLIGFSSGSKK